MEARNHPWRTVERGVGLTLCVLALPVALYALLLTGSLDRDCLDTYWCPSVLERASVTLACGIGAIAAICMVVMAGTRFVRRDRPGRGAWLLAVGGPLLAVAVLIGELYYAGAQGAFS